MATGRHTEGNKKGLTSVVLVAALLAAGGGLAWVAFKPGDGGTAAACDGASPVIVSVIPAMKAPMDRAVSDLSADDECFLVDVRVETSDLLEDSFFSGNRPDLFVADTPARVDRIATVGVNSTTVAASLANSPVGLVGGPDATAPDTWIEALTSGQYVPGNPEQEPAAALSLMAPSMEADVTKATDTELMQATVLSAMDYGQLVVEANNGVVAPVSERMDKVTTEYLPITEQEYVNQGAAVDRLEVVVPKTGAPALTFPLVKANGGAPNSDIVATELSSWFSSADGASALAEAGLRTADGTPLEDRGFGEVKDLGDIPSAEFIDVIGGFNVMSMPSSLLTVFDVSGSMNYPVGNRTRIDFAIESALVALDQFTPQTRIGLWAFSIDQDGPGKDYAELAPLKQLQDETQGIEHRKFLASRAKGMKEMVRGGTGLYDTTLAAYESALEEYDRAYFNTVILLADGQNEDQGSISLEELKSELESMKDKQRPVRIIAIGITKDADMEALKQISETTGGSAYLAEEPGDVLNVLGHAVMSR